MWDLRGQASFIVSCDTPEANATQAIPQCTVSTQPPIQSARAQCTCAVRNAMDKEMCVNMPGSRHSVPVCANSRATQSAIENRGHIRARRPQKACRVALAQPSPRAFLEERRAGRI